MIDTKTLLDPIAMWRQSLDRLEGQVNTAATSNMENERVARALSVVMNASVGAQNVFDKSLHKFYERLDIPARSELAAVAAAVQRVEDRLAELFPQAAKAAADRRDRPARTRKPAPEAAAATEQTPPAAPARAKRARRTRP